MGAQLNNVEDEPETMGAGESQEWSFASLGQPQASLGSSLLHQMINDWEECISHPKGQMTSVQNTVDPLKHDSNLDVIQSGGEE